MSVPQAHAFPARIERPVSLSRAFLLSLPIHAVILLTLLYLNAPSVLFDRPVERPFEPDPSVRFSFAPEPERAEERGPEGSPQLDAPDSAPEEAPPATEPEAAPPDPDARATLDEPQPRVLPRPMQPPSTPAAQPEIQAGSDEPPSDGLDDVVEGGETRELEVDVDESADEQELEAAADADSSAQESIETKLDLAETDDGSNAILEQPRLPTPVEAPAPGRPFGPSLDERISEFGQAVQRLRPEPRPQQGQQPANVFEPDWPNLPPTGQALGNLTFESGDFDWDDYGRQIYWIIWRTWHNRLLARADDFEKWAQQNSIGMLDHINAVRFTIESNGEISHIVLEMDSGMVPFDLSSTEALDEALLPPLPADFPRDNEVVHAQFIGYGPIGNMRRGLQQFKSRGLF